MNLLDRKSGLILLALLFSLFSCEDPTGSGEVDPKDKVGVHYEEIPLSSSIILTDSIVGFDTRYGENNPGWRRILAGSYSDPIFGEVSSTAFSQLGLSSSKIPEDAVFDSIAFSFVPTYQYATDFSEPFSLSIHRIKSEAVLVDTTYLTSTTIPYFEEEIGSKSFIKLVDTVTYHVRINDEVGEDLFNKLKDKAPEVETQNEFVKYFKGVALVSNSKNGVIGLNPHPSTSYFKIYYKAEDSDGKLTQRSYTISFGGVSLSNISADKNGTILNDIKEPFVDYVTDDEYTYIQAGTGIVTKLDLSPFTEFVESTPNIIINAAKLELNGIDNSDSKFRIPGLVLFEANQNNKIIKNSLNPLIVSTDNTNSGLLRFEETKNTFSAEIADHLQMIKSGRAFSSILIYPTQNALSVNRLKIPKDEIKLKVYYTKVR